MVYFFLNMKKGNGFSDGVKAFVEKTGLDVEGKKCSRSVLKPLSDKLNVIVKGDGFNFNP